MSVKHDIQLEQFIERTVAKHCPASVPVSEVALRELRPVFEELLRVRTALEDVVMTWKGNPQVLGLETVDAIARAEKALK